MPIVYEPAQPVRADISTGYGALQQWNVDFDRQMRLAEFQAQLANRNFQAGLHGGGVGGGGAGGGAGGMPSGIPLPDPMEQAQNQAGLQAQLQALPLSQAENLRLQRMQQADDYINQAVQNHTLDEDSAQDARMQLHTGISTLQQRQARARQQLEEDQHQLMVRMVARQAAADEQRMRFLNTNPEDRLSYTYDPETQRQVQEEYMSHFPDHDPDDIDDEDQRRINNEVTRRGGRNTWLLQPDGTRQLISGAGGGSTRNTRSGTSTGGRASQAPSEPRQQDVTSVMNHYADYYRRVEEAVNRDPNLQGSEHNEERRARIDSAVQAFTERYQAMEGRLFGPGGRNTEQRARNDWHGRVEQYARAYRAAQGGAATEGMGRAAAPVRQITSAMRDEDLPADQQEAMRGFQENLRRVGDWGVDREHQGRLTRDIQGARELYMRYGSVQAMPPTEFTLYRSIMSRINDAATSWRERRRRESTERREAADRAQAQPSPYPAWTGAFDPSRGYGAARE